MCSFTKSFLIPFSSCKQPDIPVPNLFPLSSAAPRARSADIPFFLSESSRFLMSLFLDILSKYIITFRHRMISNLSDAGMGSIRLRLWKRTQDFNSSSTRKVLPLVSPQYFLLHSGGRPSSSFTGYSPSGPCPGPSRRYR